MTFSPVLHLSFCLSQATLSVKEVDQDLGQPATVVRGAMVGGFKNCTKYSVSYFKNFALSSI